MDAFLEAIRPTEPHPRGMPSASSAVPQSGPSSFRARLSRWTERILEAVSGAQTLEQTAQALGPVTAAVKDEGMRPGLVFNEAIKSLLAQGRADVAEAVAGAMPSAGVSRDLVTYTLLCRYWMRRGEPERAHHWLWVMGHTGRAPPPGSDGAARAAAAAAAGEGLRPDKGLLSTFARGHLALLDFGAASHFLRALVDAGHAGEASEALLNAASAALHAGRPEAFDRLCGYLASSGFKPTAGQYISWIGTGGRPETAEQAARLFQLAEQLYPQYMDPARQESDTRARLFNACLKAIVDAAERPYGGRAGSPSPSPSPAPSPGPAARPRSPVPGGRPLSPPPSARPHSPAPGGRPLSPAPAGRPHSPGPASRPRSPVPGGRPQSPAPAGRPLSPAPAGLPRSAAGGGARGLQRRRGQGLACAAAWLERGERELGVSVSAVSLDILARAHVRAGRYLEAAELLARMARLEGPARPPWPQLRSLLSALADARQYGLVREAAEAAAAAGWPLDAPLFARWLRPLLHDDGPDGPEYTAAFELALRCLPPADALAAAWNPRLAALPAEAALAALPSVPSPDAGSYAAVMRSATRAGRADEALALCPRDLPPDRALMNALIEALLGTGDKNGAWALLAAMERREHDASGAELPAPDRTTYRAFVASFLAAHRIDDARRLHARARRHGITLSPNTLQAIANALAEEGGDAGEVRLWESRARAAAMAARIKHSAGTHAHHAPHAHGRPRP